MASSPSSNPATEPVVGAVAEQTNQERRPAFLQNVPEDKFLENEDTILGTPQNYALVQNFVNHPDTKGLVTAFDRGVALYEKWQKDVAQYNETHRIENSARRVQMEGTAAYDPPKLHPYVSWMTQRGKTRAEIISGINRERDKADFLFERMKRKGVDAFIDNNPEVTHYPQTFAASLLEQGYLKDEEEVKFFVKNAKDKYSNHFGTSVYDKIWMSRLREGKTKNLLPFELQQMLAQGYRLNPGNPHDVKMLRAALEASESVEFSEVFMRFQDSFAHLIGSVVGSVVTSVEATITPEWDWAPLYRDATGERLKLKNEFLVEFQKMLDMHAKGELMSSDIDTQLLKFAGKFDMDEKAMENTEFDLLDPTKGKEIGMAQVNKVMGLYRSLVEKKAIVEDPHGLNALMSNLDAILTATAGWGNLLTSTDPQSLLTAAGGTQLAAYYQITGQANGWDDASIKGRMRYLNASADFQAMHRSWLINGTPLINSLPTDIAEGLKDRSVMQNTGMWADIFVASALGRGVLKGLIRTTGGETFGAARSGAAVAAAEAEKASAIAAQIVRNAVELPSEVRTVIDGVKAVAKEGGTVIDDYAAIEAIMSGNAKYLNPVTGTVEAVSPGLIDATRKSILERLANTNKVRKQLIDVVKESRKVRYTADTNETISMIRKQLAEAEPKAGWENATDMQIYNRARMGDLSRSATSALPEIPKSRMDKLFKEVGDSWKRFSKDDLVGWEKFESLEAFMSSKGIVRELKGMARAARTIQDAVDSVFARVKDVHPPSAAEVGNIIRLGSETVPEASMNITAGSTAYRQWNEGRRIFSLMNLFGYGDYVADFMSDWLKVSAIPSENFASGLRKMKEMYGKTLASKIEELRRMKMLEGKTVPRKDIAALETEVERLAAKQNFAALGHALFSNGFGMGVANLANGFRSATFNEGLLYLSDTHMIGAATGYSYGFKSLNLAHRSFLRNFSETYGVNERTNLDLIEIGNRMAEMAPDQRRAVTEIIMALAAKRDEVKATKGVGVLKKHPGADADIWFAQSISLLARSFHTNGQVRYLPSEVITSATSLYSAQDFMNDPELALAMRDQFLTVAAQQGLKGDEAKAYADKLLQQHRDSVALQYRRGVITTEVNDITTKINQLNKMTNENLAEVIQAQEALAKELGLDIVRMEAREDGTIIGYDKEGKSVPIVGLSADQIKRIDAFKADYRKMNSIRITNNTAVEKLNKRLGELQAEADKIDRTPSVATFRDGEVRTLSNGEVVYKKKGVTMFESPVKDADGNMTIKTTILIDKDYFIKMADPARREAGGMAVIGEELSHILWMSDAAAPGRVMFTNALFGKWVLNEHNEWTMTEKPSITGDIEKNIALLDMFVKDYAEGLDPADKAAYLARFEHGKRMWKRNKADFRFLNDALMELFGQVHVQRMMLNNPQARRSAASGSTIIGGVETSPILAGNPRWKRYLKFVSGEATAMDFLMEGTAEKAMKLMDKSGLRDPLYSGIDDPALVAELDKIEADVRNVFKFLDIFGAGGIADRLAQNRYVQLAYASGLRDNKNLSPDPMKFWSGQIWDERTGQPIPIHPSLIRSVEETVALTRAIPGRITPQDNLHWELIEKEQDLDVPEAARRRVMWALATGRRHWIGDGHKFKGRVRDLFYAENKPIEDFLKYAVEINDKGEMFGLTPYRNASGHIKLVGAPNRAQAKKILDYLTKVSREVEGDLQTPNYSEVGHEKYMEWMNRNAKVGPYRINPEVLKNIAIALESVARSDIFDNENIVEQTAGYLPIFTFEYQGVTTGVGPGTTAKVNARNLSPSLRRAAFIGFSVEQSFLDKDGKPIEKVKDGETTGELGGARDSMYGWIINIDNLDRRLRDGWDGNLIGSDGAKYNWTHKEMHSMFNGNFANLTKAVNITLRNFADGGPYNPRTKTAQFPPQRTWQALLEMNGGNEAAAMRMADVVLRIIGFPDNELSELTRLDRYWDPASETWKKALLTESEKRRYNELKEKFKDAKIDDSRRFFAELNAMHPNEVGASPMWDTRMIFEKVRFDRIVGELTQMKNADGTNTVIPWTAYTRLWGTANYARAQAWTSLRVNEVSDITSANNMQGWSIVEGQQHLSGYRAFLLRDATKKSAAYKGAMKWVVFDSEGKIIPGEFEFKKDAYDAAEKHNAANPLNKVPSINNKFEADMSDAGFLPSGTEMWLGKRSEFVSNDGQWRVVYNKGTGKWSLHETSQNMLVSTGISLKFSEKGVEGANVAELQAHIKNAIESNAVEVILRKEEHRKLEERGIMEWVRVKSIDGTVVQQRYAANQPVYWAFKKHLTNMFDASYANAITELMQKQLGKDVVADPNNQRLVIEWIQNYRAEAMKKGEFGFLFERALAPQMETFEQESARLRNENELERGRPLKDKRAAQPTQLPPSKPNWMTNATWEYMQQEFNRASLNYEAQKVWDETGKTVQQLAAEQEARDLSGKREQFIRFSNWLKTIERDQVKFAEKNAAPDVIPDPNREGVQLANALAHMRGLLRAAKESVETEAFTNNYGYYIHSVSYKRPREPFGVKVEFTSVHERVTGVRSQKNLFFVFNPSGKLIGEAYNIEDASDIANDDALGLKKTRTEVVMEAVRQETAEAAKKEKSDEENRVGLLKRYAPPRSPTRVPPSR
jgi:hypothetical protein